MRKILFDVFSGVFAFHLGPVEFFEEVECGIEGFLSNAVGPLPSIVEFEVSALRLLEHLGSENEYKVADVNFAIWRS
jgi:hypothetical protein